MDKNLQKGNFMQIKELLDLTHWIDENIKPLATAKSYQNLYSVLSGNTQGRQQQPFEEQKNKIIESINHIECKGLSHDQEDMLDRMGILSVIGKQGVNNLENILFRNNLDISTAATEINKIQQSITGAIQSSDALQQNLKKYLPADFDFYEDCEEGEVLMRIHFQKDVSLNNVAKFEEFGKKWHEIGRGIAMAHSTSPEDIKVVGASKGSIIIELGMAAGIALTASKVINGALKVVEKSLGIKKALKELKLLDLNIEKAQLDIEKQSKELKENGISSMVRDISKDLNISTNNGEGDKIKALEKSVKGLVDFVEKGGEVDFYAPEQNSQNDDIDKLKAKFEEMKQLEKKLLALENKS